MLYRWVVRLNKYNLLFTSSADWGSGWSEGMDYLIEETQQISSPDINGSQDDANSILNTTNLVNGGKQEKQ